MKKIMCMLLSVVMACLPAACEARQDWQESYDSVFPQHEPYGEGIGAMPGRVVWNYDTDSVLWDGEDNIPRYVLKKCAVLLVPYFVWNILYGILTQILHRGGFSLGETLSFKTLFLSPFIDGYQFMYNFSSWFVPALFLVEVINVVMRKVLGILRLKNEWLILIGCLFMGMVTIWLAIGGHVWGMYKFPGRLLLMLPGFQMGRIYRENWRHMIRCQTGYIF